MARFHSPYIDGSSLLSMQNKNKKIVCQDINGKQYEASIKELSFRPSVYGVIIQDNKILLSKQWDGYDFPGGGVDLGETIEEALTREVKEETGLNVKAGRIVSCENSFFKLPFKGNFVHSILMYYLCEIVSGKISTDYFDTDEKKCADKPGWIDISRIREIKFYNSIDSIKVIKEAERIRKLLIK